MNCISSNAIACINEHGYSIGAHLGSGGYGKCFVVFSEKYKENFVCKIIHAPAEDMVKRASFLREVKSLSSVNHPNIVKIYEYFQRDDDLFMILEHCERGSMQDIITKHKFISESELRQIVFDVLSGIEYCHQKGIAHRDIKPSNILIDRYGHAKLCDFGLALLWMQNKRCSMFIGSIQFMSPEIVRKQLHQPFKPDVWAVGVTFYYLVTRRLPFFTNNIIDVKKLICSGDHAEIFGEIPNYIRQIIKLCLTVDPHSRPDISQLKKLLPADKSMKPRISNKWKYLPHPIIHPRMRIVHHDSLCY